MKFWGLAVQNYFGWVFFVVKRGDDFPPSSFLLFPFGMTTLMTWEIYKALPLFLI